MEQQQKLRLARLEIALAICSSGDGDKAAKQKVLKGICEADPVIGEILRRYGVDVDLLYLKG